MYGYEYAEDEDNEDYEETQGECYLCCVLLLLRLLYIAPFYMLMLFWLICVCSCVLSAEHTIMHNFVLKHFTFIFLYYCLMFSVTWWW